MLRFSLHMFVADMKRSFRGAWMFIPLSLVFLVIMPFFDMQITSIGYLIIMTMAFVSPRFSRIHYVVPLTEKQIKILFVLRIAILCSIMLVEAFVIVGISKWQNWEWNRHGFNVLAFYMVMLLICSQNGLQGFGVKKEFMARHVIGIIGGIFSMLIAFGLLTDYLPFGWEITISYALVLFFVGYMFYYLKDVKFGDYTYVPAGLWDDGKVERK